MAKKNTTLIEQTRPLFGRAVFDNIGLIKGFDKCGLKKRVPIKVLLTQDKQQ